MTTESPEPRSRDEIERDQLMTPPEACDCFWKEPHSSFDCDYQERAFEYVQCRDRLAADVGPLLERLDQQTAEIERLRGEVEAYKRYEDEAERQFVEYVDEAAESRAELAAAQARAEEAEAKIDSVEALCVAVEHRMMATAKPSEIRAALAGDDARPQDEPAMHGAKSSAANTAWVGRIQSCPNPVCSCLLGAQPQCPHFKGWAARPQPNGGSE